MCACNRLQIWASPRPPSTDGRAWIASTYCIATISWTCLAWSPCALHHQSVESAVATCPCWPLQYGAFSELGMT
ncbi:hypothetical protein PsYK624_144750 [Phanerochaete sordida]|uniref:Uncharacterized protein n=1 Tax=Phanerochaete sordida TaxID=48140 RepID=A0A9P3GQ16_9APHY|nr:hypothetical protein PsYK624_144750 [Phanerochaete sordida]